MGNIWSANTLLGIPVDETIHDQKSRQAYIDHAKQSSKEIIRKFPKCNTVANTFRFDKADNHLLYYTTLFMNNQMFVSSAYAAEIVVDRSGSGDCFMAGLIYGIYNQHEPSEVLNYATAAAFGKLQEHGDATGQDVFTFSKTKGENE